MRRGAARLGAVYVDQTARLLRRKLDNSLTKYRPYASERVERPVESFSSRPAVPGRVARTGYRSILLQICDSRPFLLRDGASHSGATARVLSIAGARDQPIARRSGSRRRGMSWTKCCGQQTRMGALTPERVAASAIQQAARHERALQSCLAELGGVDAPTSDLAETARRRAMRHAERAIGLARTAIRVNRDPLAEAVLRVAAGAPRAERAAGGADGAIDGRRGASRCGRLTPPEMSRLTSAVRGAPRSSRIVTIIRFASSTVAAMK